MELKSRLIISKELQLYVRMSEGHKRRPSLVPTADSRNLHQLSHVASPCKHREEGILQQPVPTTM